jgi:hypothetical protein
MKRTSLLTTGATLTGIAMLALPIAVWADRDYDHDHRDDHGHGHTHVVVSERVIDNRYHHDHYYWPHGHEVEVLPHAAVTVHFGGGPFYYHEGVWYRPHGPHYVVVAPPFGVVVPILPPFYTTLWVSGIPYYYANSVYYTWRPEEHGYVVTQPPEEKEVSTQAAPAADQLFIYPKNGQSQQQQATDRYECHAWATKETSYDPTLPGGGVPANDSNDKRAAYFRAMTACLEGRSYSVK